MHDETTCICNYNSMHDLFHLIIHQCCNLLHTNAVKQVDYNGYITWGKLGKEHDIVVDPHHQFGQPVIQGTNINAATIFSMYQSGESVWTIGTLYDITEEQVNDAILFCKPKAAR